MKRFHVHLYVDDLSRNIASIPVSLPRNPPGSKRTTPSGCWKTLR